MLILLAHKKGVTFRFKQRVTNKNTFLKNNTSMLYDKLVHNFMFCLVVISWIPFQLKFWFSLAVFFSLCKNRAIYTTLFSAFSTLVLAYFSYQCRECRTLRSGIIWEACQLAISMNSSGPEVIGVSTYAGTALIGNAARLPASLFFCS